MRIIETLGDLRSKRVLVHSDSNVPLEDGKIIGGGRIRTALPALTRLVETGAKVVVMAHLGRPRGKIDSAFSLAPAAKRLGEFIDAPVTLAKDAVGESVKATVEALKNGEIALLEDVRYNARETFKVGEERGGLAAAYAELGSAFASDGFSVIHRKQTSVYDIAKLLPSASGPLALKGVESLRKATDDPERPYDVVFGGSKTSDRPGVIANLPKKVDRLFIGGGMAFTFLAVQGHSVGRLLLEEEQIDTVRGHIAETAERGVELILPIDVVVVLEFAADVPASVVTVDQIPTDQMSLDIDPEPCKLFAEKTSSAKAVTWNGPVGIFGFPALAGDTKAAVRALSEGDIFPVIDGGDSTAAARLLGFDESAFFHISAGDGASLELFEGEVLPDIAVLGD